MRVIVNIDVPDLPSAIAFYSKALGLQLQRILEGDVAELTGASTTIYLLAHSAGTGIREENPRESSHDQARDQTCDHTRNHTRDHTRNYTRHWTPVHLDFVVDNIELAAQRALDAGAVREGSCVAWRGSKCITFADPFGHGFCLIEFEGETYSDD
jgi:catechol 2,3-dioxygenase-like lactoylglutathione lyase family enzyme